MLFLLSYQSGTLVEFDPNKLQDIRDLPSFVRMELFIKPGQRITPTVNCFTFVGIVVLLNSDEEQIALDYSRIHEIEASLLLCE
jgi:hypothetical protein